MRPWRTGTRSGSRVAFCASSSATGSGRSAAGTHPSWLAGAACLRAAFPRACRSATLGCAILLLTTYLQFEHPCGRIHRDDTIGESARERARLIVIAGLQVARRDLHSEITLPVLPCP